MKYLLLLSLLSLLSCATLPQKVALLNPEQDRLNKIRDLFCGFPSHDPDVVILKHSVTVETVKKSIKLGCTGNGYASR